MFRLINNNHLARSIKYTMNRPAALIKRLSVMPHNTAIPINTLIHIKLNQLPRRYIANNTKEKWSTDKLYDMHKPATDKLITQQELELELLKKDYEILKKQYQTLEESHATCNILMVIMTIAILLYLYDKFY